MLLVKNPPSNAGDTADAGPIPGLGRSPEMGNGTPLQYSCLEYSMGRGPWQAIVHRPQFMGPQRVGHDWVSDWNELAKYPSFLTVSTWWYLHTLFTSRFHYWVRISWRRSLGISLIMHPWWLPWLAEHGKHEWMVFCAYEPPGGLVKSRFCFSKSEMKLKICICIKSKLSGDADAAPTTLLSKV